MNSFLLPEFLVLYRALPESVRQQARQAYSLFQQDPHHPSLRFQQVHPTRPIFSARVGRLGYVREMTSDGSRSARIRSTIIC